MIRPSIIVVGLSILLAACSPAQTTPTRRPTVTPDPIRDAARKLDIELLSCKIDSDGDARMEGKITNNGDDALEYVEIRLIAKDKTGKIIGTETWFIDSDILYPGATSSFDGFVRVSGDANYCDFELEDFWIVD